MFQRALETIEVWGIDAVPQVQTEWSDRSAITNSEANSVHHVIEVLQITLAEPKIDVLDFVVNIAHIVKQDAAEIVADQGEAQFGGMEQERVASERKPCFDIARTRLIIWKRTVRGGAAGEPSLGQRNFRRSSDSLNVTELQAARDHYIFADGMVGRVAE